MKPIFVRTAATVAGTAALVAVAATAPAAAARAATGQPATPGAVSRPPAAASGRTSPDVPYPGHPLILVPGGHVSGALDGPQSLSSVESSNWSGYAAVRPHRTFRSVRATFFVPYLNCSAGGAGSRYSSHWVGLDGFADRSVEQDGIEADCFGNQPAYHAWYEFFPRPEMRASLQVRAGQSVTSAVTYHRWNRKFTLALTDNTTGRSFRVSLRCQVRCERSSAEVISEAPTLIGSGGTYRLAQLADYGALAYSGVSITTTRGVTGSVRSPDWNTVRIIQVSLKDPHPTVARPTYADGSSFAIYWQRPS